MHPMAINLTQYEKYEIGYRGLYRREFIDTLKPMEELDTTSFKPKGLVPFGADFLPIQ